MNLQTPFNSLQTPSHLQVPRKEATVADTDATHQQGDKPAWPQDKPLFVPPLYKQRYEAIVQLIKKYRPRRVADFGCSQCRLLQRIKWEPYVEELAGVDINRGILVHNSHTLQPLASDYLKPRDNRLTVRLYSGSVADSDARLRGYDFVSCVELIEHLDPEVLAALPGVLLGHVCPQVAVITTPNVEFNVLMPGLKGLRHWDHRFEWTRSEFQAWCTDVAQTYGYSVDFGGVGLAPPDHQHLGFCSQMAVFQNINPWLKSFHHTVKDTGAPYELVFECVYPTLQDKCRRDSMLLIEVQVVVNQALQRHQMRKGQWTDNANTDTSKSPMYLLPTRNCATFPFTDWSGFPQHFCSGNRTLFDGTVLQPAHGWPPVRQTAIASAYNGTEILIDLAMIYLSDKVQKLCASMEDLRQVLKSTSTFQLSHDESAIVCHLP